MKILIACGTGIVCSSIIRMKLEKLCEENSLIPVIDQCSFKEINDHLEDVDLLLLAADTYETYPVETVIVYDYLSDNDETADRNVLEALEKLRNR